MVVINPIQPTCGGFHETQTYAVITEKIWSVLSQMQTFCRRTQYFRTHTTIYFRFVRVSAANRTTIAIARTPISWCFPLSFQFILINIVLCHYDFLILRLFLWRVQESVLISVGIQISCLGIPVLAQTFNITVGLK